MVDANRSKSATAGEWQRGGGAGRSIGTTSRLPGLAGWPSSISIASMAPGISSASTTDESSGHARLAEGDAQDQEDTQNRNQEQHHREILHPCRSHAYPPVDCWRPYVADDLIDALPGRFVPLPIRCPQIGGRYGKARHLSRRALPSRDLLTGSFDRRAIQPPHQTVGNLS